MMRSGLLSYHNEVLAPEVEAFPRTAYPLVPVMAPLWTESLSLRQGRIFFRNTSNQVQLSWVREMIVSRNPDLSDYQPSVAFVVTWHNLMLPNRQSVSHKPAITAYTDLYVTPTDYLSGCNIHQQ